MVKDNNELIVDNVVENLPNSYQEGEVAHIEVDQNSNNEIDSNTNLQEQLQVEQAVENQEKQIIEQDELKQDQGII